MIAWKDILAQVKKICVKRAFLLEKEIDKVENYIAKLERENEELKKRLKELEKRVKTLEKAQTKRKAKTENKANEKKLQYLFGKYLSIWNNEPPERWKSERWREMLGRLFKKGLKLYNDNAEELWKEYENFFQLYDAFKSGKLNHLSREEKIKLSRLFYDGSFSNFIQKLSVLKQEKKLDKVGKPQYSPIDWFSI
jgi:chromosome segregation ATPase